MAHDRIGVLLDDGRFDRIRSAVVSRAEGVAPVPGDGVVAGFGRIDGRPVAVYAQDGAFMAGSLGATHAATIVRVLRIARERGIPVVGIVESGGARLQEGVLALDGYARVFREMVAARAAIPQISLVIGSAAGGGAYSPALGDFVVMTSESSMFLTGPWVVNEAMSEQVDAADLGGPRVHGANGVADLVAPDFTSAARMARHLLAFLPASIGETPHSEPCASSRRRTTPDPSTGVPARGREVYDIREPIHRIVDSPVRSDSRSAGPAWMELNPRWGRSMVTGFGRVEGRVVGIIANQPRWLGGTIDFAAAEKGSKFVATCDRFGVPLVVLVDTPGFLPGSKQEAAGVIRHGAGLVAAFAAATVPRMTVVLRKAFGGAYIVMNSRGLGADMVLAWPGAEIGVMAPVTAIKLTSRRRLAELDPADRQALAGRLESEYHERHCSAAAAASLGMIDEVIEPVETRGRIARFLESCAPPEQGLGRVGRRP
ncbi:MAG: carboxyl transferase domain-containing protein [Solirubrobacterales bacterium]